MKLGIKGIFVFLCLFISCSNMNKDSGQGGGEKGVVDSTRVETLLIDDNLVRYSYFSNKILPDSMKFFYRKEKQLQSVFYIDYHPNGILSEAYYPGGRLQQITYALPKPLKGDTLSITYYENGSISGAQVCLQDSMLYPVKYFRYYPNGKIELMGDYDMFNAVVVSCGTWCNYDSLGYLQDKNTYYHHNQSDKAYIITEEYDGKGNMLSKKIYNDYVLYESKPLELKKIP